MEKMEGVSVSLYKGLKGYWRRRDYQRIDGSGQGRRKTRVEFFHHHRDITSSAGSGSSPSSTTNLKQRKKKKGRRRSLFSWRVKVTPKLRFFFRVSNPRNLFKRLRDAYVRMMISFSRSSVFVGGYGCESGSGGGYGLGKAPPTMEEKVIMEIYKSLMAQGHLVQHNQ